MTTDGNPEGRDLPAELPLLLFHAAGVALGVEAAAVERILDAEQARQSEVACRDLAELLGTAGTPVSAPKKQLLLKGRGLRCGIGIDSIDGIVAIPTAALQPLPEPLAHFQGTRTFWGGMVRADKVVLLVDPDRLLESARALADNPG